MSSHPAHAPRDRRVAVTVALLLAGLAFVPPSQSQPVAPGREDPGGKDTSDSKAPKSAGLRFSHARGFYSASFDLALSSGGKAGTIRYTLDGSAPGPGQGFDYDRPIRIGGTTVVRAALVSPSGESSRPQTHTYLFPADIVRQSPDGLPPADWPYAWGENVVDYGMDPAIVDDPAYRDQVQPALKSLPSYSLVLDLSDLFDERRGIYANSGQSGRDWERPASLELIHPDGRKGFQEECGVRIRGGFSAGGFNPKHAFRLFFRKEYGAGKLKFPVFGPGGAQEFDSFDLRCAQNYSWNIGGDARGLFLRDQFNRDLQRALGQPAARGDFCHLYLNGQYWGLYDTCERPEASYAAASFGGKEEDYDVVKTGGARGMSLGATDGTMDAWNQLHAAAKAGLADNAAYFRLQGRKPDGTPDPTLPVLLDPTNLVDYLLVIWYGGNLDAPVTRFGGNRAPNNWHALRHRTARDGFRFFVWDAEHTFLDIEEDRTGPFPGGDRPDGSHPQWLFQQCAENAEFRVLVADRIHRHLSNGGVLSPESVLRRFRNRVREIEAAVICESARWGDAGGAFGFGPPGMPQRPMRVGPDGQPRPAPRTRDVEWRAEVNRLTEDYFPKRTEIVRFQLWRQGLVSDLPAPRFSPAPDPDQAPRQITLSASTGEIWYTLDGSDPRRVGGEPSPTARRGTGPIELADRNRTTITARVRLGKEWGPVASTDDPNPSGR